MTTTSEEEGMISAEEWAKISPFLLCVDDEGWEKIKVNWLKACRLAGKNCAVELESVSTLIKQLDDIARSLSPK